MKNKIIHHIKLRIKFLEYMENFSIEDDDIFRMAEYQVRKEELEQLLEEINEN